MWITDGKVPVPGARTGKLANQTPLVVWLTKSHLPFQLNGNDWPDAPQRKLYATSQMRAWRSGLHANR